MRELDPIGNSFRVVPSGVLAILKVAKHHGLHFDKQRFMRLNRISQACLSPTEIIRCANTAGLRAVGLRGGWKGILSKSKHYPLICILKDGEAMVLHRMISDSSGISFVLEDPGVAEDTSIILSQQAFRSIWDGQIILIQADRSATAKSEEFNFGKIFREVARERHIVRDVFISALMLSLLALTPILFFRLAGERVIPFQAMSTFIVLCICTSILIVFESTFSTLRRWLLLRLTTHIDVKLSTDMFTKVLNLPVEYFERTSAGVTLHKMGQLGRVRNFLVGQLFGTMLDTGILLFFVPLMFFISPLLTAVALAIAASIFAWIVFMLPLYRLRSGAVEAAEAQRGAFLSQSIQGIRTIKSLALEEHQAHEWDSLTAELARLRFEEGKIGNVIFSVVTPLERLMVIGSFGLGVYLSLKSGSASSIDSLFTFMLLSQRLASPLIQASQLINQYDEARNAVGIVGSLINQPPEEGRSGNGVRNTLRGHIEFQSVLFQYRGAVKPALKNVTFEIPEGTTLGVMGRSGSGKTTVTRLLQRLNTEYSGLVKVDGIDVRNYDITHFRSSLGIVLQENFLFSGTIRSNITMAKPEATFDEMVIAARLAGAEEFIDKLPNGYETYVYEGSPNLSGGQRQRLAIARALISDPKILILDEATSALDAESEAIVNANIERISQGRTVITISHRLASLVKADAILVMEQGEVNDIGKHYELLERNEIYANLWYTQNPHTAAPAAPRAQLTYRGPQSVA